MTSKSLRIPMVLLASLALTAGCTKKKEAAPAQQPAASNEALKPGEKPEVIVETTQGSFTIQLEPQKAPESVKNFLEYVDARFYDGTIFHRVIPGFVVQGGGFTADMEKKATRAPIKNEAANGLRNVTGSVAMARTSDPDSATSQFYVNLANNDSLDHRDTSSRGIGYAVFGHVTDGLDVVQRIAAVPSGTKNGMRNVPNEPVIIKSMRRAK